MNFELKKWHIWLGIAMAFVGIIMSGVVTQFNVWQPAYTLNVFDLEEVFLLMVIPFIIGIGFGIYYQKDE
jgi:cadmium resistance protein CadD (predicted permease)